MRVAVIGAGWAGLAAAVAAAQAGQRPTVFEAAREAGGRARGLTLALPDGQAVRLDNGQHILIGAYTATLQLMREVGVDPRQTLRRLPLTLAYPDGTGLVWPDGPAPWDAVLGIARARGWRWSERLALLRWALAWRLSGFACPPRASVADLCAGLPGRLREEFLEPLCLSALNTPMHEASGEVFLRVLRDALFAPGTHGLRGSNLLLPCVDLGALLPDAATHWLTRHGHPLRLGQRVHALQAVGRSHAGTPARWQVDGEDFDRVILATPPGEATRLVLAAGACEDAAPALRTWAAAAAALRFQAITTVYALAKAGLPRPMLALRTTSDAPAQFVFDRGQLGGPAGLLAFVVSASTGEREDVQARVVAQAWAQLGQAVRPLRTVTEKRATFACTPGLVRPAQRIAPGLWAAGDYVAGPYPATLEGAVRSGRAAGDMR